MESPYQGQAGEIWMVRLVPAANQHIAVTTPYLIEAFKEDWQNYFSCHGITNESEYRAHMKGGRCYWLNYLWTHYKTIQSGIVVVQGCQNRVPD